MKYRTEVDGLRAIAILPVVFFHAGFKAFEGGFVGVDVFFVVSGYLITTIILFDMENNAFSIVTFYERRARRILPALFFVMLCCLPFAWVWLLPSHFKDFTQSLVAVAAFSSNILFWQESGYFGVASELKPLLHTWSLAIEEQYYVLFPLFLMLLWKLRKRWVFSALVVVGVVSLAAAQWGAYNKPSATFFLLPTRAWELAIGALIAFYLSYKREHAGLPKRFKNTSEVFGTIGLLMIFYSVFVFDNNTPFPSFFALIPTVGTGLVIIFATSETVAGRFLSTKCMVWVGLISYSTYLWHYPLFAFARHSSLTEPSAALLLLLSAASLLIAYISWRYVESPFRNRELISRKMVFAFAAVGSITFAGIGLAGHLGNEYFSKMRLTRQQISIIDEGAKKSLRHDMLGLSNVKPNWMLIGDSHANSLQDSLHKMVVKMNASAVVATADGCPPALNLYRHDLNTGLTCHNNYSNVLSAIESEGIDNVLISARFPLYLNSERFDNREGGIEKGVTKEVIFDDVKHKGTIRAPSIRSNTIKKHLIDYVKKISDIGVNVYVLGSIPEVGWDATVAALEKLKTGNEVRTKRSVYVERNLLVTSFYDEIVKFKNVRVIHSENSFCDSEYCYATENGIPLYFDSNHLNVHGAEKLVKHVFEQINIDTDSVQTGEPTQKDEP